MIDSYPIAACDNYRIPQAEIYQGEDWRGYIPSKKRYFYGAGSMFWQQNMHPAEFFLVPGATNAVSALGLYNFDLPKESLVMGDKAYNDYVIEDIMKDAGIVLSPIRKKNSLRPVPPFIFYFRSTLQKVVETTVSLIERLLPKSIHVVPSKGFELKATLFVLACSINFLW